MFDPMFCALDQTLTPWIKLEEKKSGQRVGPEYTNTKLDIHAVLQLVSMLRHVSDTCFSRC